MTRRTDGVSMKLLPHAEMIRLAKAVSEAEEALNDAIVEAHEAGMRTQVEVRHRLNYSHWRGGDGATVPLVSCVTVYPVQIERRYIPGPPMGCGPAGE